MIQKSSILVLGVLGILLMGGISLALYKQAPAPVEPISALIVPHHDLVAGLRKKLFSDSKITALKPSTIILVSPNHYESGAATIQTTEQAWETQAGTLQPNLSLIHQLATGNLANLSPGSFSNEHGIKNLVGDIKATFPEASVIPLIFKLKTSEADVSKLSSFLSENCQQCLVIASVDFSHYQTAPLADLHDDVSLRGLLTQDRSLLSSVAETDSPASLSFTVAWALAHHTNHFNLWNHTNSSTLAGDPSIPGTSHIFGWYEAGSTEFAPAQATFSIGSALPSTDSLNRTLWGTDVRILFGSSQPLPHRPGEVTVTDQGFVTWDNQVVQNLFLSTPLPLQVLFDTGKDFSFSPSDHVIVVVSTKERAEYATLHGAVLVASGIDLGATSLHDIPLVSALPGTLASGTVKPKLAQVTSHTVLQDQ
jgi:AmmeMemoRadiSam system protein B